MKATSATLSTQTPFTLAELLIRHQMGMNLERKLMRDKLTSLQGQPS
jgi:hypothetical protein